MFFVCHILIRDLPEFFRISKTDCKVIPFFFPKIIHRIIRSHHPISKPFIIMMLFHTFAQEIIQIFHLNITVRMFKSSHRHALLTDQKIMIIIVSVDHMIFCPRFFKNTVQIHIFQYFQHSVCPKIHLVISL